MSVTCLYLMNHFDAKKDNSKLFMPWHANEVENAFLELDTENKLQIDFGQYQNCKYTQCNPNDETKESNTPEINRNKSV